MNIIKNTENLLASIRDGISRLVNGKQVVGYQSITITIAAVSVLTVPAGATEALINTDSTASAGTLAAARWTINGTTPVAGVTGTEEGMPIFDGIAITLKGADALKSFKIINAFTTVRAVKVTYFK